MKNRLPYRMALLCIIAFAVVHPSVSSPQTATPQQTAQEKAKIRPSKYSAPLPRGEFRNEQIELAPDAERRQLRESRYKGTYPEVRDPAETDPTGPAEESIVVINDYAEPIDPFPALRAAAVVVGTVLDGKAFVSSNQTYIYSDFHVRIDQVLKPDPSANLAVGGQLVASRGGGAIHFPSGRIRNYVNQGEGVPAVGSQYLFFLVKPNIPEPEYEVIIGGAYELRDGKVHPLDDLSTEFDNASQQQFLAKVQLAIKSPNGGRP